MIYRDKKFFVKATMSQLLILLFALICYCSMDLESFYTKTVFEISYLLVMIQAFYVQRRLHEDWKNISNLFLFFFFFFLGNRFLFDLVSDEYNVCYFEFFLNRMVNVAVVNRALFNLIIAVCSYTIGTIWWISRKQGRRNEKIPYLSVAGLMSQKTVYLMLFIGFVFKGYYSYQTYQALLTQGYLQYFIGGFAINRNLLMMFLEAFYEIAIFILISQKERLNKIDILLIIVYVIMSLATGQRGFAMLSFVFILFYMYKLGRIKLGFTAIVVLGIVLFVVASSMSYIRGGKEFSMEEIMNAFFDFFYGQSISITVLVATIDYENYIDFSFWDLFGHIRYLLTYYWDKLTFQFERPVDALTLQAEEYKWYGQYISSITNQDMFYRGLGLGSSYMGQFYAVGKEYMQLLGGVFVGYLVEFLYDKVCLPHFLKRFWAFHALTIIVFISRANLFEFINMQWHVYVVSVLLYIYFIHLNRILYRRTNNKCSKYV